MKMKLTENIKKFRKESGMTQQQLAEKVGVTRQTISKWEKGLSLPDAESLTALADIFHVPVNELLGTDKEYKNADDLNTSLLLMLNEQLMRRERRTTIILRTIFIIFLIYVIAMALLILFNVVIPVSIYTISS